MNSPNRNTLVSMLNRTGTQFFDSLMAWLPVRENCPSQADGEPNGAMCYLASEDAAEELPSLSFRQEM